jgi:hypothetical protein
VTDRQPDLDLFAVALMLANFKPCNEAGPVFSLFLRRDPLYVLKTGEDQVAIKKEQSLPLWLRDGA